MKEKLEDLRKIKDLEFMMKKRRNFGILNFFNTF